MWEGFSISDDTIQMLNSLVARKQKWDRYQRITNWGAAVSVVVGVWLVVQYFQISSSHNALLFFHRLTESPFSLAFLLTAASLATTITYSNKAKEAKDKYEKLREETIEHLRTRWTRTELAQERYRISKKLKEEFDINISYIG